MSNPELSRTMRMHQAAPELLELAQWIGNNHSPECTGNHDEATCDCGTLKARELLARHGLEAQP